MTNSKSPSQVWKEVRRLQALELQRRGWKQKDIAEALGVTKGAVSQWLTLAAAQGDAALLARPRPGATPRLTREEKLRLPNLLAAGAAAYGFRGQVWTCARVATVIGQGYLTIYSTRSLNLWM